MDFDSLAALYLQGNISNGSADIGYEFCFDSFSVNCPITVLFFLFLLRSLRRLFYLGECFSHFIFLLLCQLFTV